MSSRLPLLHPEFDNPLFLHLLCQHLQRNGLTDIPAEIPGILAVFSTYLDDVNKKLAKRLRYCESDDVVAKAVHHFVEYMVAHDSSDIPLSDCRRITDSLLPGRTDYLNSLFYGLLSEGVVNTFRFSHNAEPKVVFAYERFGDHLRVRQMLSGIPDEASLKEAFQTDGLLAGAIEHKSSFSLSEGLLSAFAIQIPGKYEIEFPNVISENLRDDESVVHAFIESLAWREESIAESSREYLLEHCLPPHAAFRQYLGVLLLVAPKPNHPLNADYLHHALARQTMPVRDSEWTVELDALFDEGNCNRVLEWTLYSLRAGELDSEPARLLATLLAWFFTSPNRLLRDRSTKALVRLFGFHPAVILTTVERFHDIDDPYVVERVLCATYGAVLRMRRIELAEELSNVAQEVMQCFFIGRRPPANLMIRDYAASIIEAVASVVGKNSFDMAIVRPPYGAVFPGLLPDMDDVEGPPSVDSRGADGFHFVRNSLGSMGDFRHYIQQYACSRWVRFPLSGPRLSDPKSALQDFYRSLSPRGKLFFEEYLFQMSSSARHVSNEVFCFPEMSEDPGPFSDLIDDPEVDQVEILVFMEERENIHTRQFAGTLTNEDQRKWQQQIEQALLPLLTPEQLERFELLGKVIDNPASVHYQHQWSGANFSGWLLQRVAKLGYDNALHGYFDNSVGYRGRTPHGSERIGKKYQWLAFYELLACLTDNYHWDGSRENGYNYEGSWQLSVRNIDPSCLLDERNIANPCPVEIAGWELPFRPAWCRGGDTQRVEWMKSDVDLPELARLIETKTSHDGSDWLLLDGYFDYESPRQHGCPASSEESMDVWFCIHSYLVRTEHLDNVVGWVRRQRLGSSALPKPNKSSHTFLGEWYWSNAYKHHQQCYYGYEGWTQECYGGLSEIPAPIHVTAESHEYEGEYDFSRRMQIDLRLPSAPVSESMNLHWVPEAGMAPPNGEIVATDSFLWGQPSALLMKRVPFLHALEHEGLSVFWTIFGEKNFYVRATGQWPGRLTFCGCSAFDDEGRLTTSFSPFFEGG